MSQKRPKGEIGKFYTLTSDFDGRNVTTNKKAGFTWQCEELDSFGEPMIDGVVIGVNESYRVAMFNEITKTKKEQIVSKEETKAKLDQVEISFVVGDIIDVELKMIQAIQKAQTTWKKRLLFKIYALTISDNLNDSNYLQNQKINLTTDEKDLIISYQKLSLEYEKLLK